jgi:hypothetical protein
MRRIGRWIQNAGAAVSLVVLVATIVLWVRSYWVNDYVAIQRPLATPRICEVWTLISNRGLAGFGWQDGNFIVGRGVQVSHRLPFRWTGRTTFWNTLGFSYDSGSVKSTIFYSYWKVLIPCWSLALFASILPLVAFVRSRREQKVKGHCTKCGYDLRGNISGVCPECGLRLRIGRGS